MNAGFQPFYFCYYMCFFATLFKKNDQVFVVQVDLKWIFKLLLFKSSFALPLTIVLMPCNSFSGE